MLSANGVYAFVALGNGVSCFRHASVFGADLWIKDAVLLYLNFITELRNLEIQKGCKAESCVF